MAQRIKVKRRVGDVVMIPLPEEGYAYGRVLEEPLMAFYDLKSSTKLSVEEIIEVPVAFKIDVMNHAITEGTWPIIGKASLTDDLKEEPLFFKKDPITKQLSIYQDSTGIETPATAAQCKGLECAAVWEPEHVVDRLVDHFAGRPNRWVESMRASD